GTISETNSITLNTKGDNNWIRLNFSYGNVRYAEMSDLLLKFEVSEYVTITEAVSLGYIEPLTLVGAISSYQNYYFPTGYNLLSGGSSGIGSYPFIVILIKPTNIKLTSISFSSNANYVITDAKVTIDEFLNFDISLTPNNN
ncbi:MAG: hypothetical protein PHE54_02230, partial [Bacilli bacterium]|nr:hypothetical protein [Bacilli bacterium]